MRLTLRTLLAYLDGVLPAADQADLAARVDASAVAQSLVARIRQVIRQSTIGAPRVGGRGLGDDANSVAEYLDNALEPVRLEMLERICLESDMHLAEVASCHAMLAEVARDPAVIHDLDDAGRQRLLRAVRQRLAPLAARAEREEARANADVVRATVQAAAEETDTVFVPDVAPATLMPEKSGGRGSWVAWASAAVAVLLLVSLVGVLAWSVASRRQRRDDKPHVVAAVEETATKQIAAAALPVPPLEQPVAQPRPQATSEVAVPDEPAAPVAAAPPAALPIDETPMPPEPAEPQPAAPVPAAPPATPLVPHGNALAIAAPPPPAAPVAAVLAPATQPPGPPPAGFVGPASFVLHRTAASDWAVLSADAALAARERLVAPPGFHPDITIGGVTIRLLPATEVLTSFDDDGTPRIEIIRGRIVARAGRADARLGITAAALAGTVTAGLGAPIAVVVDVDRAAGDDPAERLPRVRAEVFTTSGPIGWRQRMAADTRPLEGIAAEGMLEARAAMVWNSSRPTLVTIAQAASQPGWVAAAPAVDAVEKRASEAVAAKVLSTEPLIRGLRELASDRRAENRVAAVSTLALIGEYDELVELLCAEEPGRRLEGKQWATLEGQAVPLALTRGPDHAAALRQAFLTHGPQGKGELLDELARGFADDALAAGADRGLVEALDDPALVVRRYAIKNIVDIVRPAATDRLRYRADGLPDLRREGAEWWRGQLEKGLIRRPPAG